MKTFFALLVIIIAFFVYIFVGQEKPQTLQSNSHSLSMNNNTQPVAPLTLEAVEEEQEVQIQKEQTAMLPNNTSATPVPNAIPENQTFETIKQILIESAARSYTPTVTLNTRIDSLLYKKQMKEQFKQKIAATFSLPLTHVDSAYKEHKIVWDWVNMIETSQP